MKRQRITGMAKGFAAVAVLCFVLLGMGAYFLSETPELLTAKTDEKKTSTNSAESGTTTVVNPSATASSQAGAFVPPEKMIYGEMQLSYSWICDVSVPENLLQNGGFAVKLKVLSVGETKYLGDDWIVYCQPATPYQVELRGIIDEGAVDSRVLRDLEGKSKITVHVVGGIVSMKDAIEHAGPDRGKKFGVGEETFTEKEKESKYIAYTSDFDYAMIPGEEYAAILHTDTDGTYYVSCQGYGIFRSDASKSGLTGYKNVITGNELKLD